MDVEPQIHLGEKASAMERAGIHTIRGDINRRILANNDVIEQARAEQSRVRTRVVVRASDESDEEFEALREAVAGATKRGGDVRGAVGPWRRQLGGRAFQCTSARANFARHIRGERTLQGKEERI